MSLFGERKVKTFGFNLKYLDLDLQSDSDFLDLICHQIELFKALLAQAYCNGCAKLTSIAFIFSDHSPRQAPG